LQKEKEDFEEANVQLEEFNQAYIEEESEKRS
jgi:hypothetical protein